LADTVSPEVEQYVLQEVQQLTERAADWLLRHARQPAAMAAAVGRLRPSVRQLTARLRQGTLPGPQTRPAPRTPT
jgi:NAD-specific glutamate dehydrogenase